MGQPMERGLATPPPSRCRALLALSQGLSRAHRSAQCTQQPSRRTTAAPLPCPAGAGAGPERTQGAQAAGRLPPRPAGAVPGPPGLAQGPQERTVHPAAPLPPHCRPTVVPCAGWSRARSHTEAGRLPRGWPHAPALRRAPLAFSGDGVDRDGHGEQLVRPLQVLPQAPQRRMGQLRPLDARRRPPYGQACDAGDAGAGALPCRFARAAGAAGRGEGSGRAHRGARAPICC